MKVFRSLGMSLCLLAIVGVASYGALAVDNTLEANLKKAFEAGELPGLHSVHVVRNDDVLGEAYFRGDDERWGASLGRRAHGPDTLHDLRSVTKSVVGLPASCTNVREGQVKPPSRVSDFACNWPPTVVDRPNGATHDRPNGATWMG